MAVSWQFTSLRRALKSHCTISSVHVQDVRFDPDKLIYTPGALSKRPVGRLKIKDGEGSDSMHTDSTHSAVYVVISASKGWNGCGYTFTIGRGNEVVCAAVSALGPFVEGKSLLDIYTNFGAFWHSLSFECQLHWIGPEKGVIHLAVAAIINALWDLWGKIVGKPVWRLLSDMTPEEIVSLLDWQYLSDALTKEEALDILQQKAPTRSKRIEELMKHGYPAYNTSIGWWRYSDEQIKELCQKAIEMGFSRFKVKVGLDLNDDVQRLNVVREQIGSESTLVMDANQCWEVPQAIEHINVLAQFKPLWIEEPTSPDDILGHAEISKKVKPLGVGVATGKHCPNRVMFKQFLKAQGMDYCQIDVCRLGGVNEAIVVLLLAAKFQIPVCPHAGGVGLCELAQHMAFFDYVCVSGTKELRMLEYSSHLHEHFVHPVRIESGAYIPPTAPGFSSEIKKESLRLYDEIRSDPPQPVKPRWTS